MEGDGRLDLTSAFPDARRSRSLGDSFPARCVVQTWIDEVAARLVDEADGEALALAGPPASPLSEHQECIGQVEPLFGQHVAIALRMLGVLLAPALLSLDEVVQPTPPFSERLCIGRTRRSGSVRRRPRAG